MCMRYWLLIITSAVLTELYGQQTDTIPNRNLYDSIQAREQYVRDSILARETFVKDSILAREIFIRDSILAREIFVRDSLIKRQKITDSVFFLKNELQNLLEAYSMANDEKIILDFRPIPVIGDSMLGEFVYSSLPFGVRDPYCPWKTKLILSGKAIRIEKNSRNTLIKSIHTPQFKALFDQPSRNLLIIHHPAAIQKNGNGSFYKNPVDSVLYDAEGRIARIKSSMVFYSLTAGNQKGQYLFTNTIQVKQYRYKDNNEYDSFQLVRFCERWKTWESNKVCSIINYTFEKNGNEIKLLRRNDPVNQYSDGTYTFTFNDNRDLSGISFINSSNTEGWERTIELNREGNVSCYIDKSKGRIFQSLCMIYHPEPGARFPVETITTTFEKDGISYFQKNNTSGKSRTRDRMTLEWSTWN
jgi:hypothetical protein